ncbi:hypothetical protein [Nonomuraea wenchangensis]|uniref:hypothetical protein n=2 Tax=Nonomuraea wenchangensis TaxID=568860 RepID=UPI0033E17C08
MSWEFRSPIQPVQQVFTRHEAHAELTPMKPETLMLLPMCVTFAAVLMVAVAIRGCTPGERARVLRAVAEVIRAFWGKR